MPFKLIYLSGHIDKMAKICYYYIIVELNFSSHPFFHNSGNTALPTALGGRERRPNMTKKNSEGSRLNTDFDQHDPNDDVDYGEEVDPLQISRYDTSRDRGLVPNIDFWHRHFTEIFLRRAHRRFQKGTFLMLFETSHPKLSYTHRRDKHQTTQARK